MRLFCFLSQPRCDGSFYCNMGYMNKFALVVVGIVSGFISYVLGFVVFSDIYFIPGAVFGIAIAGYFLYYNRPTVISLKILVWISVSTLSYYTAVYTTIRLLKTNIGETIYVPFLLGGIIGTFLMLVGFHYFLFHLNVKQCIVLVLLGGILGLSWFVGARAPIQSFVSEAKVSFLTLFVVWQTVMGFALGWVMSGKR